MCLTPWTALTVGTEIAVVRARMTRAIRTRTITGARPRMRRASWNSTSLTRQPCPRKSLLSPSGDCFCPLSIYGAANPDLREWRASAHPNAQNIVLLIESPSPSASSPVRAARRRGRRPRAPERSGPKAGSTVQPAARSRSGRSIAASGRRRRRSSPVIMMSRPLGGERRGMGAPARRMGQWWQQNSRGLSQLKRRSA
jgi:hypothetical protein